MHPDLHRKRTHYTSHYVQDPTSSVINQRLISGTREQSASHTRSRSMQRGGGGRRCSGIYFSHISWYCFTLETALNHVHSTWISFKVGHRSFAKLNYSAPPDLKSVVFFMWFCYIFFQIILFMFSLFVLQIFLNIFPGSDLAII